MAVFNRDRTPLLLFLAGTIASIALLLLVAYAPDLRGDVSNEENAVSRSAVGFAGLKRLMDLSGIPAEIDHGVKSGERGRPSLTILTPPIETTPEEWHDYAEQGAVLIILPKWITAPMPLRSEWVVKVAAHEPQSISKMLEPIAPYNVVQNPGDFKNVTVNVDSRLPHAPPRISGNIQQLQHFRSIRRGGYNMLVLTPPRAEGVSLLVQVRGGDKPIYVLADPDLMNNQGLADASKAQLALAIIRALRQGNGPVWMDVTMNGMSRAPNLLKALFEPPFRGATLATFLVAMLMALHALARFGAPLGPARMLVRGKKALANNTAELVRIMGREAAMAPRYVQATRNLVLARLGGRARGAAEQDGLLARMEAINHSGIHYGQLAAEAATARTSGDLLRIAARAYAWRRKLTSEH